MTLIGLAKDAIDALKDTVTATLVTNHDPKYTVKILMRQPTREDGNLVSVIIPTRVTPTYPIMNRTFENGIVDVRLIMILRKPFDDDGTTLLNDVGLVLEALRSVKLNKPTWDLLDYPQGVRFDTTDIVDNWVFQGAEIGIQIKIN